MVRLLVKVSAERDEFLYDTSVGISNEILIGEIVAVQNLRARVQALACACRELASFGPLREEETRGLSEEVLRLSGLSLLEEPEKGNRTDPHAMRTGNISESAELITRAVDEAETVISCERVSRNVESSLSELVQVFRQLKGSVMIAYPGFGRLPKWDPARVVLDEVEESNAPSETIAMTAAHSSCSNSTFKLEDTLLWWAGKELRKEKKLCDFVGFNEKTKIVVRLAKHSSGAPTREPRVDSETHKAMLAFYHKREEESKRLEREAEESYDADNAFNAPWADPKSLKKNLLGTGDSISWR